MLSILDTVAFDALLVVTVSVVTALGLLALVRRLAPPERLGQINDVIGSYSTVVGTLYAVILAFMLYAEWTDFETARTNTDKEGHTLADIYRLADGLPEPAHTSFRQLPRAYAEAMLNGEWAAMSTNHPRSDTQRIHDRLWQVATHLHPASGEEQILVDHLLYQLETLSELRRARLLQLQRRLPGILSSVLIVGAVFTVVVFYLFSVASHRLHMLKVAGLTAFLALVLFALYEMDGAYVGTVRVTPDSFALALRTFDQLDEQ